MKPYTRLSFAELLTHLPLQAYVHAQLTQPWSPEQIARGLKAEYPDAPHDACLP